ncbi:hypothetical protein KY285_010643 [Solanum tuberosum]|nr:hypothetical protein KY285_010643 [Solanum tuberosum]
MVHLPIHLAGEAEIAGPIHYRWMYPIERWLYFLKSLIGNRACPEGSIAEGYIANECMTLCSREFAQNHIDTAQNLSDTEWDREFIEWFKDRVAQLHKTDNSQLMEDLLSLSRGPTKYSTHSNGYIVNGYRFHIEDHDQMLRTQNCGVVVVGENDNDSENVDYYGILTDVIELQFISNRRVILFRCNWFDVFDMKTENEDGSIMKSTIRYSFVAPGAIGRGRGRGLKSLTSKGKVSTKSSLFESSDLVKKYIQEVETSAIEKGRQQQLTNFPMSSSHEKRAINENSNMSLEKEYMQVNTSFHPSTKQAKQYIHDVETSAIGKGRGAGHKNSTMSSSQVPTPFSSFTNQVKKCTKEVETRVSENIVKSSQGLPSINKNTLVLEKENTQAKSPSSIDQVMQPSQTTETGSSNPSKVKRVRGSNKCKEVASLEAGKRLKDKFESVDLNDYHDHIFGWMNELWNKWRGYLHATYVKNKPIVQALKNIPKGVEKKEWEWLVKEHFCSESFQARSNRNAENRAKLKMYHHIGSKPIREIIYQQGGKDGNPPNLATIFFETRKKDNMLVEPEAIEKHVCLAQIEEILKVEPSLPSIEIVEKCCGPQTRSHVFGFGGGVKAKDMRGGTSSKTELLSQLRSTQEENISLNEKNKSLNDRLSTLEDEMKEIRKMQEFFATQQSHNPHMTSPVSTE